MEALAEEGRSGAADRLVSVSRTDVQVAECGEDDGQPDGNGVRRVGKVSVEHEEDRPAVRVPLGRDLPSVQTVEVYGVRDVRQHGQQVGHGQRGQKVVRRVDHILARQNDHVENVADDPDRAHDQTDVPVVVRVPLGEAFQVGSHHGWTLDELSTYRVWCHETRVRLPGQQRRSETQVHTYPVLSFPEISSNSPFFPEILTSNE